MKSQFPPEPRLVAPGTAAWVAAFLMACGGTALARAADVPFDPQDKATAAKPQDSDPDASKKEWKQINDDYQKALQEYYRPYEEAKTEEESRKVVLDSSKDPNPKFAKRIREFAERARGQDAALDALQWIMAKPMQFGGKVPEWVSEGAKFALDEVLNHYIQHPKAARVVDMIPYSSRVLAPKTVTDALAKIEKESHDREVQATAAFGILNADGESSFSRKLDSAAARARANRLKELIKKYEGTGPAKRAGGEIFELENLQVGMTAPEILGTDENGKPFKLSEYRGKVVVLDFWGFW
jgi:hypothetical protein